VYRCLWEALVRAVSADAGAGVHALVFAFPLLIVTGGRAPAQVPGVLADIGRVRVVLADHGILGQAGNFGLGNGLCSLAALEALAPSRLYALARAPLPNAGLARTRRHHRQRGQGSALPARCRADAGPRAELPEVGSAIAIWEWR
jgi:hypothetical protein